MTKEEKLKALQDSTNASRKVDSMKISLSATLRFQDDPEIATYIQSEQFLQEVDAFDAAITAWEATLPATAQVMQEQNLPMLVDDEDIARVRNLVQKLRQLHPPTKTREEVELLKTNWRCDPCWDIESTEGFEQYHDELLAYRLQYEKERQELYEKVFVARMQDAGITDRNLAKYIFMLEDRITDLEDKIQY